LRDRRHPGSSRRSILGTRFGSWHRSGESGRALLLGGGFLGITGGRGAVCYADMGHFGKGPIRRSWYGIALPSCFIQLRGADGFLIDKGRETARGQSFLQIAQVVAIYPLVVLADHATIIASQGRHHRSFSNDPGKTMRKLGAEGFVAIRKTYGQNYYGKIYVP